MVQHSRLRARSPPPPSPARGDGTVAHGRCMFILAGRSVRKRPCGMEYQLHVHIGRTHVEEANVRRGSGAPKSLHGALRSVRLDATRKRQPTRPTSLPVLDRLSQQRLLLSRERVRLDDFQGSHPASGYLGQSGRIRRLARPSGVQHRFVNSRSSTFLRAVGSLYLLYTHCGHAGMT